MLVLSRKPNQSIMIGHDIVVTVLEVRGDQVRLGIRAPRHVDVHREEVYAELQKANKAAAHVPGKEVLASLEAQARNAQEKLEKESEMTRSKGRIKETNTGKKMGEKKPET